ncbi:hypothetical protein QZH41_015687 [Actinostola sp. cb2023]|nr:hypothetical protein QZH41_015687 [Actinostola sp. cb2023]
MADWLVLLSTFIVVAAFLLLGVFISRLGVLERRALMGAPVRSTSDIPSRSLVGVRNPFDIKLREGQPRQDGIIRLILSNSVPSYMTLYWGVSMAGIDRSVCKEEQTTNCDEDDDDDDDDGDTVRDSEAINFIPIHSILSGSYESKGPMDFYETGQEHQIKAQIPAEAVDHLCRHQQDSSLFPLVVVNEWSRNIDEQLNTSIKSCDIVSLLTAFTCKSTSGSNKFSLAAQYIQIANGRIYPLKKLYVSTDDSQESTDSSSQLSSTCVVCHSMPVSRVLLPCRHACICGSCFSKLELKCPMCRQWIRSYFQTQEEPELAGNELETSRELHRMSLLGILKGIFSSS